MRKSRWMVLLLGLCLLLAGCGGSKTEAPRAEAPAQPQAETTTPAETAAPDTTADTTETADALVIYFSRTGEQYKVGVIDKGNTAIVAEMIAEATGADLFEVKPEKDTYPTTYEALTEVAKQEQADNARPAIAGDLPDFSAYSTIFIGAPVWWGDWPMIMYTLFDEADFTDTFLVPFCTHEGSRLSGLDSKLAAACPEAEVLTGLAIRGEDAQKKPETVREDVANWLPEVGY